MKRGFQESTLCLLHAVVRFVTCKILLQSEHLAQSDASTYPQPHLHPLKAPSDEHRLESLLPPQTALEQRGVKRLTFQCRLEMPVREPATIWQMKNDECAYLFQVIFQTHHTSYMLIEPKFSYW